MKVKAFACGPQLRLLKLFDRLQAWIHSILMLEVRPQGFIVVAVGVLAAL